MEAKDARGYCESCDKFEVKQSGIDVDKDYGKTGTVTEEFIVGHIDSLENTCLESKGGLRVRCPRWCREEKIEESQPKESALAFIPKKKMDLEGLSWPDWEDDFQDVGPH